MIHLFINGLAASAGGGLTYLRNVIPHLAVIPGTQVTLALAPDLRKEFDTFSNVDFVESQVSPFRRIWYEQVHLPDVIRRSHADILLSAGNFALRNSPVPQILLSRNSIYTSSDYYVDVRARHEYGTWLDTHIRALLAKRSIYWADVTVAPSHAFAAELQRWTGVEVRSIHHGFDGKVFTSDATPLAAEVEEKLVAHEDSLKLLFVSHYNYYRNFETLIRALLILRERVRGRSVKLLLTCKLAAGENPGSYRPQSAAKLLRQLGVEDMVIQLGAIPYRQLHHLYRCAHMYVTPAYTETFAHPLVEAMSSGLPVVASDLPVHREICGDAALYFPRFSEQELAARVAELSASQDLALSLSSCGVLRSRAFSWTKHVEELLSVVRSLRGCVRTPPL